MSMWIKCESKWNVLIIFQQLKWTYLINSMNTLGNARWTYKSGLLSSCHIKRVKYLEAIYLYWVALVLACHSLMTRLARFSSASLSWNLSFEKKEYRVTVVNPTAISHTFSAYYYQWFLSRYSNIFLTSTLTSAWFRQSNNLIELNAKQNKIVVKLMLH